MQSFCSADSSYTDWCRAHPHGYVLSHCPGSHDNVTIHRVDCRHLARYDSCRGDKICSLDLFELEKAAAELNGLYWRHCRACLNKARRSAWLIAR